MGYTRPSSKPYGLLCRTLDFGRRRSITFHAVRLVGNSKLCQRRAAPIREVGSLGRVDLSKSGAIRKTADGFTYLDPAQFHKYFAADLSAEQAAFMARSQVPNFADNFKAVITTAAWKSKPSWMLVAAKDRTINPDLERWYATRANTHKVEVSGASHAVYVSRPKEVAALIEDAASHAR